MDTDRYYHRKHPVVWLAVLLVIGLLIIMPVLESLPSVLEASCGSPVMLTGTVRESREGNAYLWLKLDGTDELVYVSLPQKWDEKDTAIWYPAGTKLKIAGVLEKPKGQQNPGGFDEAGWLLSKNARIKLMAEEVTVTEEPRGIWKAAWLVQCRIKETMNYFLNEEESQVAQAILLGEKQQMSQEFYRLTQRMGIAHIFAVSGLHVGFAGTCLLFVFRFFHRERSWISFLVLTSGLGFYCLITGLAPSAIRAALMILLAAAAMRLLRPPAPVDFLALAAVVLLMDNPFLLYSAGFQLSFGVTLSLLLFVQPIRKKLSAVDLPVLKRKWLCDSLAVAVSACLGSIPLTAWHFYTLSLLAPLYNLLLVPIVSVLVPAMLLAILGALLLPAGGVLFFLPVKLLLAVLIHGTVFLTKLTGTGHWYIGRPDSAAMFCYLLFLVCFWLYLRGKHGQLQAKSIFKILMTGCLLAAIVLIIPVSPQSDELFYMDAGQGSCAILRTNDGETVIFDGGTQERELASILAWYGINEVTAVVLSHGDSDHTGGIMQVLENVPVKYLCMEKHQMCREEVRSLVEKAVQCGTRLKPVEKTAVLTLHDGVIRLGSFDDGGEGTNSRELAAILQMNQAVAVFPGDLGVKGIEQLIKQEEKITIWTVPHHGSRFSASEKIYADLCRKGVKLAVVSAGTDNRYGHPHREVLELLQKNHIAVHRIDSDGAVMLKLDMFQ